MSEAVIESKTEAISEPKVEISEKDQAFKANFEKIAKQEKYNSETRKQLEEKRKAFETDKAELEKYRQFDKELQHDPLSVLEKLGLPLNKISELAQRRNQPQNPEARQALEIAKKLEQELHQEREKAKQERLSQEEIRLNANISKQIKDDGYDILEHLDAQNSVREYMEEYYNETGEIPTIKEACDAITNSLVEKISKVKDSKWLKPKEVSKEISENIINSEPKTLTNKMVQSAPKEVKARSEAERLRDAIAIMNNKK
jgi:hypothetical protein